MTRLLLSCGEASGDLYAGALVEALRRLEPDVDVFGLGGERFAAAGGRLIADFHGMSVTGLAEALSVVPRSIATLRRLTKAAREHKPHALVVIDYPDFNFRLMRFIKKQGIPVVYYISPQLWAWRPGRIKLMKRSVDRVLPIFPFESDLYQRHGIDVRFVGHPLIDLAKPRLTREAFLKKLNLDPAKPVLALLPGSRKNELERLAPVIAKAVPAIAAQVPGLQFVVARAPNLNDGLFEPFGLSGVTIRIADVQTDDVLNACDAAVTASGTATVQTALHGKPMVVRLQAVADDVSARQGPRQSRHVRDGEPDRRPPHRRRIDPGRLHSGSGNGRSGAHPDRRTVPQGDDGRSRRCAASARRTRRERSGGAGNS